MKTLCVLATLVLLGECGQPDAGKPNIEYHAIGYVMMADWQERTFVVRGDDGVLVTVKSCHGQMPIWKGERLLIHTHRAWNNFTRDYDGCDEFDWVQQAGKDAQ